jgi:predicted membrane metal-binding protein
MPENRLIGSNPRRLVFLSRPAYGAIHGSFFVLLLTWNVNCQSVGMITNSTIRISTIGVGVAVGAVLIYVANERRKNRSLLRRVRKQARMLLRARVSRMIGDSAAAWIAKGREEAARQKKGLLEAVGAGKTAYQKVAG